MIEIIRTAQRALSYLPGNFEKLVFLSLHMYLYSKDSPQLSITAAILISVKVFTRPNPIFDKTRQYSIWRIIAPSQGTVRFLWHSSVAKRVRIYQEPPRKKRDFSLYPVLKFRAGNNKEDFSCFFFRAALG